METEICKEKLKETHKPLFNSFRKTSDDSLQSLSTVFIEESELNPIKTFTPKIIIWTENIITNKLTKKVTINRADCIRKRIKTHYNQFLLKYLNQQISAAFPNLSLMKLSQNFISDVKIESNKHYLNLPLKEIFNQEFNGSRNYLNNKTVLDSILNSNEIELKALLERTYSSFYSDYLVSEFYEKDLVKLKEKEGEFYMNLFKSHSKELINYYKKGIPYRRKSSPSITPHQQEYEICSESSLSTSENGYGLIKKVIEEK